METVHILISKQVILQYKMKTPIYSQSLHNVKWEVIPMQHNM